MSDQIKNIRKNEISLLELSNDLSETSVALEKGRTILEDFTEDCFCQAQLDESEKTLFLHRYNEMQTKAFIAWDYIHEALKNIDKIQQRINTN